MGIWSTICGSYSIKKSNKFSLRKYVFDLYDESHVSYDQKDSGENLNVTFQIRFSLDGMAAAKLVETVNSKLSEVSNSREITATIRYS